MFNLLKKKTILTSLVIVLLISMFSSVNGQVTFLNVQPEIGEEFATYPNCSAWGDIDNDGDLDVYMAVGSAKGFDLMINDLDNSGKFLRADTSMAHFVRTAGPRSVLMADIENDGDLDLLAVGQDWQVWLIVNKFADTGTLSFEDVSEATGLIHFEEAYYSASMADYDNNGLLDILITGVAKDDWFPTLLYRNTTPIGGSLSFEEVSEPAGILSALGLNQLAGAWADYDNDNDQDLLIGTDDIYPVFFYRNEGDGTFLDVTTDVGLGESIGSCRALVWGDYDNDCDLDIFIGRRPVDGVEGMGKCQLFRNDGGVFTEVESAAISGIVFYGVASADYDNDGDLDLHLICSNGADHMLRNDGNNNFVNVADEAGLLQTEAPGGWGMMDISDRGGNTWADWDADGDLDLLLPGGDGGQAPYLMRNDGGNTNNWLEIKLTGVQSNRSAIGARVIARAGDLRQMREVCMGSGCMTGPPTDVHFGFGQKTVIDSLIIRWPYGTLDVFVDVDVNQIKEIVEGSGSTEVVFNNNKTPDNFELFQNYPNPFNPVTEISYQLVETGHIRLEVFSLLGQHIATLVDNVQQAGIHKIKFDASSVPSGVYVYRLVTKGYTQQKKMLFLK
jgi:enediyne biosynthesis protein E4